MLSILVLFTILVAGESFTPEEETIVQTFLRHFYVKFLYRIHKSSDGVVTVPPFRSSSYQCYINNETAFRNVKLAHSTMIVAKIPQHLDILSEILNKTPITWKMKWIVFMDNSDVDLKNFEHAYIPMNCEFIVVQNVSEKNAKLTEIYKLGRKSQLLVKPWGIWRDGRLEPPKVELLRRRQNLMGHVFQQVTMQFDYYDYDQDFQEKIVAFIRDGMNFTIISQYSELGQMSPPLSGVFKLLRDKDVDFACLPYVVTSSRMDVINFVWPTTMNKIYMFVAVGADHDWASYLKPFDTHLWIILGAWILLTIVVLSTMYIASGTSFRISCAVADAFLDSFQPFCAQGGKVVPQWVFFLARLMPYANALVLLPAYSGAVLAFLTVPVYNVPFRNLEELTNIGRFKLSFIEQTYSYRYFMDDNGPIPTKVRSLGLILSDNLPTDAEEGFKRICKDHSQVYSDSIPPREGLDCRIEKIKTELFGQPIGLAVAPDWPYQAMAIRILRRIQSAGLVELYQKLKMPTPPAYAFKALEYESVQSLFAMYSIFIILSLIALTIEHYLCKRNSNRNNLEVSPIFSRFAQEIRLRNF